MTVARDVREFNAATVRQVRGARGLLGWSQIELAHRSGVAARTLADFEAGRRVPRNGTIDRIVAAFADAGLEFIDRADGIGLFLSHEK